jgi:hypothetical protein
MSSSDYVPMPMLPNDHHPGPRCSCRECLRLYPSDLVQLHREAAARMSAAERELETLSDCGVLPPGALDLARELRDASTLWGMLSAERSASGL